MISDVIVSIIIVSMVTMLVLPNSPATGVIKTAGEFLSAAVQDVTGRNA